MGYVQPRIQRATFRAASLAATFALLHSAPAKASEIEEFGQLVLHPSDSARMLLKFAQAEGGPGGVFYTEDGGSSWKMMCGAMVAPGQNFAGAVALSSDGMMFHTAFDGLWQAQNGCDWSIAPELAVPVRDVSSDPTDPDVTFAVTADGARSNAAWRRVAGAGWEMLGTTGTSLLTRIRVVALPDAGVRIYESGQRAVMLAQGETEAPKPSYLVRFSDDLGDSWTEFSFDMAEGAERFRLEAVDPSQPDRIVVSVSFLNEPDLILVSDDKGESFRDYLRVTEFGGLSMAPDGRIWIGDRGDPSNLGRAKGLWSAENLDTMPTPLSTDYGVTCVKHQPANDTLFVCQRWQFGSVDAQSGAFTTRFDFAQSREFVACPGVDAAQLCKPQLCAAFCGPNYHFSAAPLCSVYSDPDCGPAAAELDRSSMQGNGTGPAGGRTSTNATPMMTMRSEAPDSNGGCTLQSTPALDAGAWPVVGVLAASFIARRRRHRHCKSY